MTTSHFSRIGPKTRQGVGRSHRHGELGVADVHAGRVGAALSNGLGYLVYPQPGTTTDPTQFSLLLNQSANGFEHLNRYTEKRKPAAFAIEPR